MKGYECIVCKCWGKPYRCTCKGDAPCDFCKVHKKDKDNGRPRCYLYGKGANDASD